MLLMENREPVVLSRYRIEPGIMEFVEDVKKELRIALLSYRNRWIPFSAKDIVGDTNRIWCEHDLDACQRVYEFYKTSTNNDTETWNEAAKMLGIVLVHVLAEYRDLTFKRICREDTGRGFSRSVYIKD